MDKANPAKDLRLAKKTFNVITVALIDQLLALFKDDGTLKFIKNEIEQTSKDPKNNHVGAVRFFRAMNLATAVKSTIERGDDEKIVVGELVLRQDPVIFTDEVGVVIPDLEALNMKDKWPKLSETNKVLVWDYLSRMAKTSAQVVIGMQATSGQLTEIIQTLAEKGITAKPGMTEEQLSQFAEQVKSVCESKK